MSTDIEDAILSAATEPRKASNDSTSVEAHSLSDQIAADRYLQSKAAAAGSGLGIRLTKIVPPGAS